MMQLREAALNLQHATIAGDASARFMRVHTDTRTAQAGDLFVALKGERFDAHDFLPQLLEKRVAAAMVAPYAQIPDGLAAIVVPDPKRALGELARAWRKRFSPALVMVTGSNGKTTTKDMVATIFRAAAGEARVLATKGNLNNDIGLPLTLLGLRGEHRFAVIEAGMNHPGETAELAAIAQPTIVLITNAQREHQEFMVSVEAVAREHALGVHALPADGTAVFPADDAYAGIWRAAAGTRRSLEFNSEGVHAISMRVLSQNGLETRMNIASSIGEYPVTLRIGGHHNVRNAAAALAAAHAAGVDAAAIAQGLNAFTPAKGRMQRLTHSGFVLVDDTYNANPDSVRAAIDVLTSLSGRRVLVLGDMGEVGEHSAAFHSEVGAYAAQCGVQSLITMGVATQASLAAFVTAAPGAQAGHANSVQEAADLIAALALTQDDTVLVKGSRFMAMERVIQKLQEMERAPC
ncbi:MAG: UDP-N-acetylmuramoyl-tripeptide:D-alanyl-D-alanine ligase [Pseudomonadota bacterium]|jgi:UDP-N-acetylmuramoyl-tripeptide--D-alanyl-D-alanine ligase